MVSAVMEEGMCIHLTAQVKLEKVLQCMGGLGRHMLTGNNESGGTLWRLRRWGERQKKYWEEDGVRGGEKMRKKWLWAVDVKNPSIPAWHLCCEWMSLALMRMNVCFCMCVCSCSSRELCVHCQWQSSYCIYTCSFGEKGRIPLSDTDVSYQHQTVGRNKHLSTYFQSLLEILPTVIVL